MGDLKFIKLSRELLPFVRDIYNYYIKNTTYTFHRTPVTVSDLATFIPLNHIRYKSYIVQSINKQGEFEACGYCYLSQYKKREAYDGTVEISIYFKPEWTGNGLGKETFHFIESIAIEQKFNTILAFVSGDNPISMNFFNKMGFKQCGHFKKVGMKFGKLLDVFVFQKMLIKE